MQVYPGKRSCKVCLQLSAGSLPHEVVRELKSTCACCIAGRGQPGSAAVDVLNRGLACCRGRPATICSSAAAARTMQKFLLAISKTRQGAETTIVGPKPTNPGHWNDWFLVRQLFYRQWSASNTSTHCLRGKVYHLLVHKPWQYRVRPFLPVVPFEPPSALGLLMLVTPYE